MKKIKRFWCVLLVLFFFCILYNWLIYRIKKYILINTPFIILTYTEYVSFYEKYDYVPEQSVLLDSIPDPGNELLKFRLKFFKCNMLVTKDYYYLYEYGFDNKDDNLKSYFNTLEDYKFINFILCKKGDFLLFKAPTKEKLKRDKMKQEGIKPPQILPPGKKSKDKSNR